MQHTLGGGDVRQIAEGSGVSECGHHLNAQSGKNVFYPLKIGHPCRIRVGVRCYEAHRVWDRSARFSERAEHRVEGEVNTIILRPAKPSALDRNNFEVDLGLHIPVSYTHLRAHETDSYLVCRLLLE